MYIKVFPRGKGRGAGPVEYAIRPDDPATGELREVRPEILRGDPEQTRRLIDLAGEGRTWKYSSGVCSWAPGEIVTPEQEQTFMDEFEAVAFAGLEEDQRDVLWVRHGHADHHELHFVVPRVELSTGKAMNPFAPGWQKDFDPLRDKWNISEGWSRPDDPARARLTQPGIFAQLSGDKKRFLAVVNEYVAQEVTEGRVENRGDLLSSLQEVGLGVAKEAKNYVTVKDEAGNRHRLKGAIYQADFIRERFIAENPSPDGAEPGRDREADQRRVAELERELERIRAKRTDYNRGRYTGRGEADHEADQQRAAADREAVPEPGPEDGGDPHRDLARHLRRELGHGAVSVMADRPGPGREAGGHPGHGRNTNEIEGVGVGPERERGREIPRPAPGPHPANRVFERKKRSGEDREKIERTERYDQAREAAQQRDRENAQRALAAGAAITAASRGLASACDEIDQCLQPGRAITPGQVRTFMDQELDEMKRVNIADYAASQGYRLNRAKSSRSVVCMDHPNGDRVVIGRDEKSGHSVYYNFRDDQDNGTLVDFIQRRQTKSLGQVRQELRPWIGKGAQERPEVERQPDPVPVKKDRMLVAAAFAKCSLVTDRHEYLESRGVDPDILDRFKGRVFTDRRGNAIFPHYDQAGVSGFEAKNEGFTGFSKGGEKGLWLGGETKAPARIVVTEAAIDALSHYQLHQADNEKTLYVSTSGAMSPEAKANLKATLDRYPEAEVVAGFDNDQDGTKYADELNEMAGERGASRELPECGKDWNEQLQREKKERDEVARTPRPRMSREDEYER